MSLTKKILIISGLIISFLALVQAGVSAYGIRSQILESITSMSTLYARSNASTIGEWLGEKRNILDAYADGLMHANTETKIRSLIRTTDRAGGFGSVLYGTSQGDTYREKGLNTKAGYDPRIRPWYKNALNSDHVYLSEPYVGASSGVLITTVSKKLKQDGELMGVAMATLPLAKINDDILSIDVPGDGMAFLISSSHIIISHPDSELANKPFSELTQSVSADDLISYADKKRLFDMNVDGVEYLVSVASIQGTNWYLVLMSVKSVLMAPVQTQLFHQFVTALVMIVVSISILGFVLGCMLSNLKKVSLALNNIALGEGNLTVHIDSKSNDEVGQLATSFNIFVQKLHDIISTVNQISNDVLKQSEFSSHVSSVRQNSIHHQKEEVVLVATAMTEMATTTGDIANNAEFTAQSARKTVEISQLGSELAQKSQSSTCRLTEEVKNSRHVIQDLDQQSDQIATIVATINDIAEQTNLLALNAAIEAARAGEQGRGFAVVADEVRNLSHRTRTSTEEISQTINSLQDTTVRAVKVMNHCHKLANQSVEDTRNSAESFKHIENSTQEINNMATQIATAAEEQAVVSKEINSNTESIKMISEQLGCDAIEGTKQAEALNLLAKDLIEQVQKFKI